MNIKDTIKEQINQVLKEKYQLEDALFQVEYPPQSDLGDYSCNIAMVLGKKLNKNPMEVGEEILGKFGDFKQEFDKVEVVKPGFINFFVKGSFLYEKVEEILKQEEKFGELKAKDKQKIQVEFISANPTGPLTLANGRGGFSGDVLANILYLAGHEVEREFYVNNFGNQVRVLGHSILKDDEAQYLGEYIDKLSEELKNNKNNLKNIDEIGVWAADKIVKEYIQPVVKKINIKFDNWFFEKNMHENGKVDAMLTELKKKDLVFEKDGAIWLKVADQDVGDDKDRVLVKSNGDKTYFLPDIAYHWDKFHDRKFDKVIDIWGADHHGYVPRLKLAVSLMGYPCQLEILLMQMVRLIKDGKEYRMSKRKGIYVLLEDLVNEVGLDVARFFFLMHANNKAMDFDMDLAKEKSQKNPVFYVQYAHARICSILKKAEDAEEVKDKCELHNSEKELIKELIKWPELVSEIAESYEVHKVAFYAVAIADKLHDFYENCKVIENDKVLESRLDIIKATKQVLQNVLKCLGVSAPEQM
ncbi:MAG: arginine--tRNA ligase [Patescibacteria group bacterium]